MKTKTLSIKIRLRQVIAFSSIILLTTVLHYGLNQNITRHIERHKIIIDFENQIQNLILKEKKSFKIKSDFEHLKNSYTRLTHKIFERGLIEECDVLIERSALLDEFMLDSAQNASLLFEVQQNLNKLIKSTRYIHQHHIAYLKNLIERGKLSHDEDMIKVAGRSPFKSRSEAEIIGAAIDIYTSLFDIFIIFQDLNSEQPHSNIEKQFLKRMQFFFSLINRFEDYSLDAQDGLLVEELLVQGRTFQQIFTDLVSRQEKLKKLDKRLDANQDHLLSLFHRKTTRLQSRNQMDHQRIKLLQIIVFALTIFLSGGVILGGRKIIAAVTETVKETRKIQKDPSYQISLQSNIPDEFQVVHRALNTMAETINGHINQLKDVHRELEYRKNAAEKANRSKSDFLANMSHELRTPLNHIIGFTEIVVDQHFGELNSLQDEYLNDVLDSSRHLLSLINDVLDLSKIEAGKMELNLSPVAIEPLLLNSLNMIREKTAGKNLIVETNIESLPDEITADERKLKQIVFNLLSNAVKFTPEGGRLRLNAHHRTNGGENDSAGNCHDHSEIRICVTDSGIGLQEDEIKKIFKPFEQAEHSKTAHYQGTGLGLALTRHMVELHGGSLGVTSKGPGKGCSFFFSIPFRLDPPSSQERQEPPHFFSGF